LVWLSGHTGGSERDAPLEPARPCAAEELSGALMAWSCEAAQAIPSNQ